MGLINKIVSAIRNYLNTIICERYGHKQATYIGHDKYICPRCQAKQWPGHI